MLTLSLKTFGLKSVFNAGLCLKDFFLGGGGISINVNLLSGFAVVIVIVRGK